MSSTIYTVCRVRFVVLTLLCLFGSANCFATQQVAVQSGMVAKALISKNDITRVYIKDDGIAEAWTASQNLDIKTDNTNGELYLTIRNEEDLTPITLFIVTDKTERLTVLLTPGVSGGETVEFSGQHAAQTGVNQPAADDTHEAKLIALIKAMHKNAPYSGYVIEKPKREVRTYGALKVKMILHYASSYWIGEKLEVTNKSKDVVELTSSALQALHPLAIGTGKISLRSGESTTIYLIKGK